MNKTVIVSVCVLFALSARAERYEFDRYQPIVDRQMFGPVPEGFDPTKPPSEVQKSAGMTEKELTKEQEQVKKSVRLSMINLNPAGETMVGFTDSSNPKEARHYYLKVGETRDGWTVKSADAVAATVAISKDGVDLDLELGAVSGGPVAAGAGTAAPGPGGMRRGGLLGGGAGGGRFSFGGRAPGAGGTFGGSLRERRAAKLQQREADEKAAAEDQAKRDAEAAAEKAKAEEEKAQREAEREQQRQQLLQIQEELKRAREARQAEEEAKGSANSSDTNDVEI